MRNEVSSINHFEFRKAVHTCSFSEVFVVSATIFIATDLKSRQGLLRSDNTTCLFLHVASFVEIERSHHLGIPAESSMGYARLLKSVNDALDSVMVVLDSSLLPSVPKPDNSIPRVVSIEPCFRGNSLKSNSAQESLGREVSLVPVHFHLSKG